MMWTIKEAQSFIIRALQPLAMESGYYLAMAGGVLNNGKSDKDLDLVAMPRTEKSKSDHLINSFATRWRITKNSKDDAFLTVPFASWIQMETGDHKIIEIAIVE